jgi:hypothetical protein
MKFPENRILTMLIAILLPAAGLTYWFLRMSTLSLAADILLVAGVIAAVALGVVVLRRGGRRLDGSRLRSLSVSFSAV